MTSGPLHLAIKGVRELVVGFSWRLRGKSGAWCGGLFDKALHSLRFRGLVVGFRGLVGVRLEGMWVFVVGFR